MDKLLADSEGELLDDEDLTVIVVGVRRAAFAKHAGLAKMRQVFPAAKYVLSTSRTEMRTSDDLSQFDRILIQDDPGLLSGDKFDGGPVDINQVRAYASHALREADTRCAVVLKPGSFLSSRKALELWRSWTGGSGNASTQSERILVSKFFTINPSYDERIAYQVSTVFQLGLVTDLLRFWSGPEYDFATVSWYEGRPHAADSLPRERAFRARYTPDQWMTLNYLYTQESFPIDYHNQFSPVILASYEQALGKAFIVAHPRDIDLFDADNESSYANTYLNMICYSYWQWEELACRAGDTRLVDFPTYRFWPREEWQRRSFIFARNKLNRKMLESFRLLPAKLLRQIYN